MPLDTKKLRQLREGKGLSLKDAAAKAGLSSPGHWSDIENGRKSNVKIDTLEAMAKVVGVKAAELLK